MVMDMAVHPPPADIDFIYRDDWLAFPPVRRQPLLSPVRYLRLCQTGGKRCDDREDCVARVRRIQETHVVEKGLDDIAFNFLVDHEGRVFEGRGWNVQAQRSPKYESLKYCCVDFGLIGDWRRHPVSEKTIKAVGDFIKYGVEKKLIKDKYLLLGYKEVNEMKEEMKRKSKNKTKQVDDDESEWEETE